MAKYDSQLTELKNLLPTAKSILIAIPAGADIDKFASGLALFLSLQAQGKEVTVASDETIRVAQSHLYGIDHVQKTLPSTGGGNLTISLEGVAATDGTIPALEKLDWFPEGTNLNLVFHVIPGQTFQPARIVPHYQGSGFNLIFVIGAASLNSLGSVYSSNQSIFSGVHIVNVDNQPANTGFGGTNINDPASSSVSEIMVDLISSLSLPFDSDTASNLLAGIFDATENMANQKVGADTYLSVANCLRVGGRKPGVNAPQQNPAFDASAFMTPPQPSEPVAPQPAPTQSEPAPTDFVAPPVVPVSTMPTPDEQFFVPSNPVQSGFNAPSPEERPAGEVVNNAETIEQPEPGWLTPKVFKGTSVG
jgi:hypothetical protein